MKYEIQCENKTSKGYEISTSWIALACFYTERQCCVCSLICCGRRAAYVLNQSNIRPNLRVNYLKVSLKSLALIYKKLLRSKIQVIKNIGSKWVGRCVRSLDFSEDLTSTCKCFQIWKERCLITKFISKKIKLFSEHNFILGRCGLDWVWISNKSFKWKLLRS